MGAYVNKYYSEGFLLKEESLLKIEDIIKRRMSSLEEFSISYVVYRSDDYFVTYTDVSDVLSEENSKRNAIKSLRIVFKTNDTKGRLDLDQEEKSLIRLESEDRDLAFLLASDLKDYLKNEVFIFGKNRLGEISQSRILAPFGMALGLLIGLFVFSLEIPHRDVSSAIASHSLENKIDFLLSREREIPSLSTLMYPVITLMIVGLLFPFFLSIFNLMSLRNTFYFGKEIETYDKKKSLREKVIWGVLVSLVVAVAGAYLYDGFKSFR